jgi:hypothetical protein
MTGEHLIRDYQFPTTIYNYFINKQRERFSNLFDRLSQGVKTPGSIHDIIESSLGERCSKDGCLSWVYKSNYINDGQERFEASDDVSFDVRGNFCADCELARRLVELRPVIYDTPEPGKEIRVSYDGFTNKLWDWEFQPYLCQCNVHVIEKKLVVCELSKDMFTYMLSMIQSVGYRKKACREVCYTFRCGQGFVNIMEKIPSPEVRDLDWQEDVLEPIRDLAGGMNFRNGHIRMTLAEINPFVVDTNDRNAGECYYDPHIKINPRTRAIHSMFINLTLPDETRLIMCCPSDFTGGVDFEVIRKLDIYPDINIYYPSIFIFTNNFAQLFVYCVMYLMERDSQKSSFSNIILNAGEFKVICRGLLDEKNAERLRSRLLLAKNGGEVTYMKAVSIIRSSLSGLRLYAE